MESKGVFSLIVALFMLGFSPILVIAETERFTVADGSFDQVGIYLNQGDELEFEISVNGGFNDDIELTIFMPDEQKTNGMIYEDFSDSITASASGLYVFSFSNTFSLLSNKDVEFEYERIQNTYYVYVDELPEYAQNYAGNAVFDATEFWKDNLPKKNFYVAENKEEADIVISWVRDFGSFNKHIGFSYMRLIEVGLGDSACYDNWKEYHSNYLTAIMIHEIGHSMGFEHSENPESVMYETINPKIERYGTPCVSPQSPEGTTETIKSITSDSQTEGGCLIATATYGTELAPQVQTLREIRDGKLLGTKSGASFMNFFNEFYYSFSPYVADYQRENPVFRESIKVAITPMVTSLSILKYVNMDSESEVLGYGVSLILLNIGMYFVAPAIVIVGIRKKL